MIITIDRNNILNDDIVDEVDGILDELDAGECTHANAYWRIGELLALAVNSEQYPRIREIADDADTIDIIL